MKKPAPHSQPTRAAVVRKHARHTCSPAAVVSVHHKDGLYIGCVIKHQDAEGNRSPFLEGARIDVIPRFYGTRVADLFSAAREVANLFWRKSRRELPR